MSAPAAFFERHVAAVFFMYGLAFFSMGLAVWLESARISEPRLARAMSALAAFGVIHGVHEWIEMFRRLGEYATSHALTLLVIDGIRVVVLVLSFLLLLLFGARLIFFEHKDVRRGRRVVLVLVGGLFGLWLLSALLTNWLYRPEPADMLTAADVLSRYILAIPGAMLAAWAMVLEQRTFRTSGLPGLRPDLLWAALALFIYGAVGQLFPRASFLFPSTVINSTLFIQLFGIPIQLFRGVDATLIAFFVIRALRTFEIQRQQHLAAVNDERLAAQREAFEAQQESRIQTEQLNRQLQIAVQDLSMLFAVSRSLATTLDPETLLKKAISTIVSSVPRINFGLILLRDRSDALVEVSHDVGEVIDPSAVEQARTVGRHVIETKQPAWVLGGEICTLPQARDPAQTDEGGRTVGFPLALRGRVAGSLVLSVRPSAPALVVRDLSLIQTLTGQLSMAIENATLYREARAREALRGELLHQVVSAQEKERQRVARELHDGTGQVLTALGLGLAAAAESVKADPSLAARQLNSLKALNVQALQEVHNVIADLRPSVLYDLGLTPALRGQLQDFEGRTGVRTEFVVTGASRRLPPEMETVVFRIAQEALTNVARHAAATSVIVRLTFGPNELQLEIQDDGRGFNSTEALQPGVRQRPGWGLLGMMERVTLVDGECQIVSTPGVGTTIRVTIRVDDARGK